MANVRERLGHRERQAQATREAVATAARHLFGRHGYVATTIEAIAAEADIPVPTIYSAFGSKAAILEEVRRLWIRDSGVAELHAEAMKVGDERERLARAAHWTCRQLELGYDVIVMHQDAARVDARVGQAWRSALAGRQVAIEVLLRSMSAKLRPGLALRRAVDLYVALTLPDIYGTLVRERRWSLRDYEAWLAQALAYQLLGR